MKRVMISAMQSGSGKTVLTCAMLRAFQLRGLTVESFKCGPDYIDPMFHEKVLQVRGRNLDLFLQGEEGLVRTIGRQKAELAIVEGAMGFYDGIAGTDEASAYSISALLNIPVILAVRPKGAGVTLAAQVKGVLDFRKNALIKGIILTDCTAALYSYLKPILERETKVPVLGFMPHMEEAAFDSRHLGLVKPDEIQDFKNRIDLAAGKLMEGCDLERVYELAKEADEAAFWEKEQDSCTKVRIAVAKDEAFCFYYKESLEALERAGAGLVYFSPLHDRELPDCSGLYIGGGYPELFAEGLWANTSMRASVQAALEKGLPCIAECGGFLYLQKALQIEKDSETKSEYGMAAYLQGTGFNAGRLQRFGYLHIVSEEDSMLFHPGDKVPAHEFHYWDTDQNGNALQAVKPDGRSWRFGFTGKNLYAGFPHLHLGWTFEEGGESTADRFVKACIDKQRE